ncbi:MAG: restriction endonuclease subunit S [Verrucomicrobia bacterium]|nr:restriction endonuclease subunit S [Deltaproteobacteria bacterium]
MSNFTTSMLGDISEYITSGSRDWSKYYSDTGALFVRTQDINKNRLDTSSSARVALPDKVEGKRTRLKKGDLLVTITGANVGKCAVVDWDIEEAYVSQSVALIRLKCPDSAKFIYHQLTCKDGDQTYLEKAAYGLGRPVLNLTNMREVPIVLASSNIQKDIVSEIEKQFSRLDEAVVSLKRIQANLKRYKAAVLKAAVEGKLTEQWRKDHPDVEPADQLLKRILAERRVKWEAEELAKMKAKGTKPKDDSWKKKYKEPAGPDTASLPELPEGWVWATIDAMAFVTKLAGFEYTKYVKYDPEGDLAVIKAENAGKNGFKRTDFSRIQSSTVAQLTRSQVSAGDLLMVFVGAGTGNVARVPDDQKYFLGPNIAMISIESTMLYPAYLELFLRSSLGNSLTTGFMKAVAQPSLSMGTIRQISVVVPPINEQQVILAEIDRRLSVTEELEATIKTNLKRAERLRQTILQQAFSGQR